MSAPTLLSSATHRLRLPVVSALLAVTGLLSCSSDVSLPRDEDLKQRLTIAGYSVQRGLVKPFRIEDCAQLTSCFGNNATSPYALWWLPPAPGTAPPVSEEMGLPADAQGRTAGWALRADEAVVYVGRTSPEAAYFSYAPYVFSRLDDQGERQPVFASVSDAVNHTHFPEGPFDREIGVIITGSPELEAELRRDLRATGLPDADIITFGLASERVRFGHGPDADTLMLLQRFALFRDAAAGAGHLDAIPAHVMRVTPSEPREGSVFAAATRAARASGEREDRLTPGLDALEAAVRARYSGSTLTPVPIIAASLVSLVLNSDTCLRNYTNCLGEISDTVYSAGPVSALGGTANTLFLGDAPGERIVVLGVNHAAFGRAIYSNLVVMNSARLAGVAAMTNDQMRGSAEGLIPDTPDAEYVYAVSIMRDCGDEPYCLEVPTGFPGVNLDEALSFVFRAYVQPGSSVSPAPQELLVERVLHVAP